MKCFSAWWGARVSVASCLAKTAFSKSTRPGSVCSNSPLSFADSQFEGVEAGKAYNCFWIAELCPMTTNRCCAVS